MSHKKTKRVKRIAPYATWKRLFKIQRGMGEERVKDQAEKSGEGKGEYEVRNVRNDDDHETRVTPVFSKKK